MAGSVVVLASLAVVAFASGGGPIAESKGPELEEGIASSHVPTTGPFAAAARRRSGYGDPRPSRVSPEALERAIKLTEQRLRGETRPVERRDRPTHVRMIRALAGRLDVSAGTMEVALGATRARLLSRFVDRGVIEAGERIVLERCLDDGDCNARSMRPISRKLRYDLAQPGSLADRKDELLHAMSRTLDQDEDAIEDALHAQLDVSLSFAVSFGALSERGKRDAIACFDDPDDGCDTDALDAIFDRMHQRGERW